MWYISGMQRTLNFFLCLLAAFFCTFAVATGRWVIALVYAALGVFFWNIVMRAE